MNDRYDQERDLRFGVLGSMRAHRGSTPLAVGTPQQQAMLAVLLLSPNGSATITCLIEGLWGESPPDAAVTTVRTYAWRWRRLMEPDRSVAPVVLVSAGDGYRLVVPPNALDLWQAEELAARAAEARSFERWEEADSLLLQALSLWRGDPLARLPGPFAQRQRARLTELRLTLIEQRLDLALRLGRHALAVPDLTAFVSENPLRESAHGLLMQALFAGGRQAEALQVYQRIRQRLIVDQGLDPGPELTELHRRVLAGDPRLLAPAREDGPPGPPGLLASGPARPAPDRPPAAEPTEPAEAEPAEAGPAGPDERPSRRAAVPDHGSRAPLPTPAQLPADTTDLVGRTAVVGRMCEVLTGAGRGAPAVLAVAGMGGVGKSVLAVHVAHRTRRWFPDGQLHADLRGVDQEPADPSIVLAEFLIALGNPAEAVPDGLEARAALYRSSLDGRRVLVLLDNARDAAQLRHLLPGSAGCAVIATSRPRLFGLPTDAEVDLDVFTPVEALELLGRLVGPERLNRGHEAALDLVTACGFLPLAVRILATRLASRRSWSLESLTRRLADERRRIAELRVGDLAVEAVFELGYRQLTPAQARAFRLVALADGPDVGVAAAAVLLDADEPETEELLESLVDAAMLQSPAAGRYRYHDLLRVFARQRARCELPGEAAAARSRWLDFLLATACTAFQRAVPGDPVSGMLGPARSAGEPLADVRAARAWAVAEFEGVVAAAEESARGEHGDRAVSEATDLLIALTPFGWEVRQELLARGARAVLAAAGRVDDARTLGRARFLNGNLALQSSRLAEAETHAREAGRLGRIAGDTAILRQALNDLGMVAQFQHRYDEAVVCFDEAITLAHELGHRSGATATTLNAALARVRSGRVDEAVEACGRVLAEPDSRSDPASAGYAHYVLGVALHRLGRHDEAVARYGECIDLSRRAGLRGREARARYQLADTLRTVGRAREAVDQADRALRLCLETGSRRDEGQALLALSRALAGVGRSADARLRCQQALDLFRQLELPEAAEARLLLDATGGAVRGDGRPGGSDGPPDGGEEYGRRPAQVERVPAVAAPDHYLGTLQVSHEPVVFHSSGSDPVSCADTPAITADRPSAAAAAAGADHGAARSSAAPARSTAAVSRVRWEGDVEPTGIGGNLPVYGSAGRRTVAESG
ncbi:BTAD domain-containing putative transcriptional regulator [Kitasatospora sp. NPDC097691]|uniref:AfsR/SARP family transcriptional regulator n=1 Tax=Kitasatospora sp. NPDC097691 TaxID=3157231 RepID=UPI00332352BC